MSTVHPPTQRDLDIHRLRFAEKLSTRRIAAQFRISQTRIRQITYRVCQWLAAVLPAKTDLQIEQDQRLAQNLAADQLQYQIETLQERWEDTKDPKYFRQQSRIILALARLGVLPGAIDCAIADLEDGGPAKTDHSATKEAAAISTPATNPPHQHAPTPAPSVGACSPAKLFTPATTTPQARPTISPSVPTSGGASASDESQSLNKLASVRQSSLENHLLTLIHQVADGDQDMLASLLEATARPDKAGIELNLEPSHAGTSIKPFEQELQNRPHQSRLIPTEIERKMKITSSQMVSSSPTTP